MGDRNNPIKFGPEWLRNFSREGSTGSSGSNQTGSGGGGGGGGGSNSSGGNSSGGGNSGGSGNNGGGGNSGGGGGPPSNSNPNSSANATASSPQPTKILLAKRRYGKEEMLALFDGNIVPPSEIRNYEVLYNARRKSPACLRYNFNEDSRDTMRGGTSTGGSLSLGDRYGTGRGTPSPDGRTRGRMPFVRPNNSMARGYSRYGVGGGGPGYERGVNPLGYEGDESAATGRAWAPNNNPQPANPVVPTSPAFSLSSPASMYRSKRPQLQTPSTQNWRKPHKEEGEEWRSPEPRPRSLQPQDKWDRDRGDRPRDKTQNNRRTWGGDTTNDDNLPEWAVDNSEACGGTFDAQGAFHGYSNDDSNLPKAQGDVHPLARSHTQGSMSRSKSTIEESPEEGEWSKHLVDMKRKKELPFHMRSNSNSVVPETNEEPQQPSPEPPKDNTEEQGKSFAIKNLFQQKALESRTFDALMRSDINQEEASDERGNFQSVMITPNNSLRQKHQNITAAAPEVTVVYSLPSEPPLPPLPPMPRPPQAEIDEAERAQDLSTQNIVDKFMEFSFVSSNHDMPIPMPPRVNRSMPNQMPMNPGLTGRPDLMSNLGMRPRFNDTTSPSIPQRLTAHIRPSVIQNRSSTRLSVEQGFRANTPMPNMSPSVSNISSMNQVLSNMRSPQGMARPSQAGPQRVMQGTGAVPKYSNAGDTPCATTTSLFMGQNGGNNASMPSNTSESQSGFFRDNMAQPPPNYPRFSKILLPPPPPPPPEYECTLSQLWYYEDPSKCIQGPFPPKEMYNWYRGGFFDSSLMVRRGCDTVMRPLGSFGPVPPFVIEVMGPFSMYGGGQMNSQSNLGIGDVNLSNISNTPQSLFGQQNMGIGDVGLPMTVPGPAMNAPQNLGIGDVMMSNMNVAKPPMDPLENLGTSDILSSLHYSNNIMMNTNSFAHPQQQPIAESVWGQGSAANMMWGQQQAPEARELPLSFWDQNQPPLPPNSIIPNIKEMKTEDEILAQLRASQGLNPNVAFMSKEGKQQNSAPAPATPHLGELEKLIQKDALTTPSVVNETVISPPTPQPPVENIKLDDEDLNSSNVSTKSNKIEKQVKSLQKDADKATKNKEISTTKSKKKTKDDRKDDVSDASREDDNSKTEKKSEETSPNKCKKEDKQSKKDLEKEKKEWIKDGFTIVKGADKISRDNKKKAEEMKALEEAERRKREEERQTLEEEKRRRQVENQRKQQESQMRQNLESVTKKAPWHASVQALQTPAREGLTLADIQRLEREKKLEQIKEQAMMQLIAQQQHSQMLREQEMQSSLGWAKKTSITPGQSLTEIQAEARKQQAATAAAAMAAQSLEEMLVPPPPLLQVPWSSSHNGGGFWDMDRTPPPPKSAERIPEPKQVEPKKKKGTPNPTPVKKETTPAQEFDTWCTQFLSIWSSKIDVPTFFAFLKDIESPYEIKDYVKCYLGESKESGDFARQFLERRSKLLRAGMITPVDDLCSPAAAVNPRAAPPTEYQEVKGKGKKTKKNKMLKIDSRILGFSVTASEDRINVGDIDTV